jgi:hypothetical protein
MATEVPHAGVSSSVGGKSFECPFTSSFNERRHPKQIPAIDRIVADEPIEIQPTALLNRITPEEPAL